MRIQRQCSSVGQGCGLGSLHGQTAGCAPQLPGFLEGWDKRLFSTVGQDYKFALLPGWSHRMVSTVGIAYWLGIQIRQNCQLSSLPKWGYQLSSQDDQSCWLGSLLRCHPNRNAVHQDLSAVCCMRHPTSLSLFDPQWLNSVDSPSDSHKMRPKWAYCKAFHNAGKVECPPWVLFFSLEKP